MRKNNTEALTNFFFELGFNPSDTRKLVFAYNRYKDNFNDLDELKNYYKVFYDNMLALGYDDEKIHFLAAMHPKSMFQKFKNGKLESYYQEYLSKVLECNSTDYIDETIEKNRAILLNLGIDKEKVACILKTNLPLAEMDPKELESNIEFYLYCGISNQELKEMIKSNSTVLLFGKKEYGILLERFTVLTKETLGSMILFYSKHNTIVQPDCLYKTLSFAMLKGLDFYKLSKWLTKNIIKNLTEEELLEAYDNLIDIGFSEFEAASAAEENFGILYKQKEKIEYIIDVGKRYAVSKEDMITILVGFPAFADLRDDKIREKISVMTRYNLTSYVVEYPKSLIQGADLIDARASYLRLFHPKVNGSEFASSVFVQESNFVKKYERDNKYLKELMPLLKK